MSTVAVQNPLFQPSTLPFGAPHFDRIQDEHYPEAFTAGMAEQRAEVEAIANATGAPTFENTVAALERTGTTLSRVASAFFCVAGAHTNDRLQQIQQEVAPELSAHSDAIFLDAALFARVHAVYEQRDGLGLDADSLRLLEETHEHFLRAGALLNDADKAKLKALNAETATLQAAFVTKVLSAAREAALHVETREELQGLSESQIDAAAAAANARGLDGFLLALQNTTQQPLLESLAVRETRRRLWERSLTRNAQGDANDTRADIGRLAQLRAERAALLGHADYATWKLQNQMARTPANAVAFLDRLVPAARAGVTREAQLLREHMSAQGVAHELAPYDWAFYAEQVRKAQYDLNEDELKPYFELNSVFERGVLFAASELYGLRFEPRTDLPVYHPDVRTYTVYDQDGAELALLYTDFYKRDSKRGGAWMSTLVDQSRLLGQRPIITNTCNYTKPAEGQPCLLTSDEVDTLFHEFGHALHGLLSDVTYASLSGTSVARDFVEFPSQFNEHWASYSTVFANYARHYATGEPMPAELEAKLRKAKHFNGGHALAEVLAAAELDMQWHTLAADAPLQDAAEFEARALAAKQVMFDAVPPRYSSTYFSHIFGGGYSAGYYAYLWAEMLDADAYAWFEENGGLTRENGERLRCMVLSCGNTADPAEMYRAWRGRDPEIGPMLAGRGIDLLMHADSAAA
ncbi:M3 family metallopeptidase [Terriglobus sp.]|uniref:M3 family metallopeptidase n=1 Tax=Terriglobus sp. TaxID=1889013 RepID=UPI003AFFDDA8